MSLHDQAFNKYSAATEMTKIPPSPKALLSLFHLLDIINRYPSAESLLFSMEFNPEWTCPFSNCPVAIQAKPKSCLPTPCY
jgi:hypothetical protein